jgi:hypothetical protein
MPENKKTVVVHVNIEMTALSLKNIVNMGKKLAGRNENGHYLIDTADLVGEMVSRFLMEKDFECYVENPDHYCS